MPGKQDAGAVAESTATIDAYLAGLPADQRAALQALRETIAAAAREAEEGLSYGVPAFRYRGRPLVSYVAAKAHCSFYPMSPKVVDEHRADLTEVVAASLEMRRGAARRNAPTRRRPLRMRRMR